MKARIPWSGWAVVLLISCFIPISQAVVLSAEASDRLVPELLLVDVALPESL